jgi:FkbM family methyltransferase
MRIKRMARAALRPWRRRLDLTEPWTISRGPATQEDIFYCFRLLLGRSPNREEWEGHAARAGDDLDAIVRSYLSSPEFSSRVDKLSLGPRASRSGLDLAEPWTIPRGTATAEDIFYCFRLLLGRSPNREEWGGHVAQAGGDLDAVVRSYVSSFEFSSRLEALLGRRQADHVSLVMSTGFSIYVQDADPAVAHHVRSGAYEPNVTAVFLQRLRPGMHVLDIGANIGYYTMLSASLITSSGSVTAIEPNPDSTKLLEASRRANSFDNVIVHQVAAGREPGLLVLHGSYSDAMTTAAPDDAAALISSTTVPCFRVDDLVPRNKNIDFVKIDVQGAEYNAMLGASELLRRCHPTIVSEFSPDVMPGISGVDGPHYLRFLVGLGYTMAIIEGGGTLRDCGTDAERVMDGYRSAGVDHIDILFEST